VSAARVGTVPVTVRPMAAEDVDAVHRVSVAAFDDLQRRFGQDPDPEPTIDAARVRLGHLLATDPGGAWVAERDGRVVGCALAIVRDGVWGLSLLVVDPRVQSGGAGRELLARARAHGDGARGFIILSSRDTRALRAYARLGLVLHPAIAARGRPLPVTDPPEVRPGSLADRPLFDAVDRAVRGAAHGDDVEALLTPSGRLLVVPERGYAVVRDGTVRLLAARDEAAAAALLRSVFANAARAGHDVAVEWITGHQAWAIDPCLEAGLDLRFDLGAVFVGGDVGPFAPYLPSGPYL
jgi:GNAT superfamily N-acetyltransferase